MVSSVSFIVALDCFALRTLRMFPPTNSVLLSAALAFIDRSERQEFEKAREIMPELVGKENAFIDFIKVESYD